MLLTFSAVFMMIKGVGIISCLPVAHRECVCQAVKVRFTVLLLEFRSLGFRVQGFRGLEFRVYGFRVSRSELGMEGTGSCFETLRTCRLSG